MKNTHGRLMGAFVSAGAIALGSVHADDYTWTGANSALFSNTGNWNPQPGSAFGATSVLYFANYSGVGSRLAQIDGTGGAFGAFVFGPETSGTGNAASVIGVRANSNTLAGVAGSTFGFSGDLATASVGIWVKSGAGANGFYYNNSGSASTSQIGTTLALNGTVTLVNDSSQAFVLNSKFVNGTSTGSLVLQNGSWLTNYSTNATAAGYSTFTGGVTLENATWEINATPTADTPSGASVLGNGIITLGKSGSASDAALVLGALDRTNRRRFTTASGNFIEVSSGAGQRVIRNNSDARELQFFARINVNDGATVRLENASSAAIFEISAADGQGVAAGGEANTGLKGAGNVYLTGGGIFYTNAGANVVGGNPVLINTFTGATTVHEGTLRFDLAGGFFKSSRIQVDQNGILKVNTTSLNYTIGNPTWLSGEERQTLAGTGQVQGTILLGTQSILRPGGDDVAGRSALSFDSALALGPLTIIDFSSNYYGAVNITGQLTLDGELRLSLAGAYNLTGESYSLFSFTSKQGDFDSVTIYQGGSLVGSLSQQGDRWVGQISGHDYAFDPSSGNLAAVPEPGTAALGVVGVLLAAVRLRKRLSRAQAS